MALFCETLNLKLRRVLAELPMSIHFLTWGNVKRAMASAIMKGDIETDDGMELNWVR